MQNAAGNLRSTKDEVFANFIVSRYEIDAKQTKAATTKIEKNKKSKCKAKSRSEEKKQ